MPTAKPTTTLSDMTRRTGETVRDNPIGTALAVAGAIAAIGAGAYLMRRRNWKTIEDFTDPLIDQQLHAGAIAY